MTRQVRIPAARAIPEGGRTSVECEGTEITVLRHGGRLFALRNTCPHANGRLGDGEIQDGSITCPLHRWRFDLATGKTRRDPRVAATVYPVTLEGDDALVTLPD